MRSLASFFLTSFAFSIFSLTACVGEKPTTNVNTPPDKFICEANNECATGEICVGGTCVFGECDPNLAITCREGTLGEEEQANYCCEIFQNCNELATCVPDPNSPINSQCIASEDCASVGDFCSGGTCYNPAGRRPCTASYQCPASERCDLTAFLCVPDNGGCNFCDVLSELCCEEGQLCDAETGFCNNPGAAECTEDTDCRGNQQCDSLGRCVQCSVDSDCGPGTICNVGSGTCYSTANNCEVDADCNEGRRCNGINECVVPQCEEDRDCDDSREKCDATIFTCYLPPAVCSELDAEPNDSIENASALTNGAFSGSICRGNTDVISFVASPAKRYRVTVAFSASVSNIVVELLSNSGAPLDSDTLFFDRNTTLIGFTSAEDTGNLYVKINGAGLDSDVESYTITIEEDDAPNVVTCSQEITLGVEPNNDVSEAFTIGLGNHTFFRCGEEDDFYRIEVPTLTGISIRLESQYDDGNLNMHLLSGVPPNGVLDLGDSGYGVGTERVDYGEVAPVMGETCQTGLEECSVFYVRIEYDPGFSTNPAQQVYSLFIAGVPRAEDCAADPHEFDGNAASAFVLADATQTHNAMLCTSSDADFYTFTLPAGLGGDVLLDGFGDGNLKLEIDNADAELVGSSDSSTRAAPVESVALPVSDTDQVFTARVLFSSTSALYASYNLRLNSYDAGSCLLSEPIANNTWQTATCVGTFDSDLPCESGSIPLENAPELSTCTALLASQTITPGCNTTCGNQDLDYYRVGQLSNGQVLRAVLKYDATLSPLDIQVLRLNEQFSAASNMSVAPVRSEVDGEAVVELTHIFSTELARDIVVLVRGQANGSYAAQPYTLDLKVSGGCFADINDVGDLQNDVPATSTVLRPNPTPGAFSTTLTDMTRCGGDTDVYNFLLFPNENMTATLVGPAGMTLSFGKGIAGDLNVPAETLLAGTVISSTAPVEPDAGTATDAGSPTPTEAVIETIEVQFTGTGYEPRYLTVEGAAEAVGAYTLTFDVTP